MEKKIKVATILQFIAAALYLLALGFIYLDISFFKIGVPQMEGWDGLGLAVVYALALIFQYPTSAVALILHTVAGLCLHSAAKKGKQVHKAVCSLLSVFGIIALLVDAYFIYCYLDIGVVLWAMLSIAAALVSVLAMVALSACKAGKLTPVAENIEITE